MADSKTFAGRFNQALDELPPGVRPPRKGAGRQQFVARMFRVSQKGARKWLEGEALPRLARIPQIAGKCGINGEWLLTGQGPMRPVAVSSGGNPQAAEPTAAHRTDPVTRRLLAQIAEAHAASRLSDADIAALEHIVQRLAGG